MREDHVHVDIRRVVFFPGRRHIPEGTEHPWAVFRWRRGAFWSTVKFRRQVPPGYLRLACRMGLHFMVEDFLWDAYRCECRKMVLRQEDLWHG